jgi:hypothetical protein
MNPHDVAAMGDVLDEVNELSDSLTIEEAVAMLEAVKQLGAAVRTTIGLLETQLCNILESARTIDGRRYEIKNDGKWRPDHSKVEAAVKRYALVDTTTGELFEASAAVDRAMMAMKNLYVTPQGMPKVGGLEALGLDKPDVARFEKQGKRLSVQEVIPDVVA